MSTDISPLPYLSFHNFKRPFVRDLAFALICPTVLTYWQDNWHNKQSNIRQLSSIHIHSSQFWQQQYSAYQDRLIELDTTTNYQLLTKFLMNRPSPHRLGFHFEGLMLFWLLDGFQHNHHSYEVVANNVQIFDRDKTLGELDFILKNHGTGDIEHWELAIKFFLGSPPFHRENWIGINSRDNLQRKIDHMTNKPFSQPSVTVNETRYDIDKRFAVIKGRFFKPVNSDFTYPDWLNPNFPLHTWVTAEQMPTYLSTKNLSLLPAHTCSLRKATYVEWFTNRPFLDEHRSINSNIADTIVQSDYETVKHSDSLATGLHFLTFFNSRLIPQNKIEPLVVL